MDDEPRVRLLLEELLDSERTPEEVCRDCPELLPQVRRRWQRKLACDAQLDAMFPAPEFNQPFNDPSSDPSSAELPPIPGHELLEVLGRGGMGVVYKARHLRLNRIVAVKMLLTGAFAGPEARERFLREAEAVAGLRHSNIIQVHDMGDQAGQPYFTMEFVEGGNLAQKLAGTPQPPRQAASLLAILSEAVQEAHRSGIVHRDLKPSNVLLTADGTPKISDFGLARRMEGESGLTWTGIAIGTPSYMAPEQAEARPLAWGPAVDIYALGAILYELLTGRPPFRTESAAQTLRQVISQDPVPPSRLNGKVPRDMETIALKCLNKEPHLRYDRAAALAADLRRFLAGEAIAARPEGRLSRLVRRARRRPVLSAAIASVTVFVAALLGGGSWLVAERAATARKVEAEGIAAEEAAGANLRDMVDSLRKGSWPEAKIALERAKAWLGHRGSKDLRSRLQQGARDLDLVAQLDAIRLAGYDRVGQSIDFSRTEKEYSEAFQEAGFDEADDHLEAAAARVRSSNIRNALLAAIDNWSFRASDPRRRRWTMEVARLADEDHAGWRARARDPAIWNDEAALFKVIETAPSPEQSTALLLEIGRHAVAPGKLRIAFLKRVQERNPRDFWINAELGHMLINEGKPEEAVGYSQAALAIRPGMPVIHNNLGSALIRANRSEEAIGHFRQEIALDAEAGAGHLNLAVTLWNLNRRDEALRELPEALRLNLRSPILLTLSGEAMDRAGKHDEAIVQIRQALAIEPSFTPAQEALSKYLRRQGREDEACDAWKKALAAAPPDHGAWYGYAEFCLYLGREGDYLAARRDLLAKFGETKFVYVAERAGRACLLRPASGDDLRRAAALAERVGAINRSSAQVPYPFFQFVLGLAEYRRGHLDRAISLMRGDASGVLGPAPRLVLAMALQQGGRSAEARKTLAEAVLVHDWKKIKVRDQDGWICHILRREAEQMILPCLPAFLEGKYRPSDNDGRLALLGICQFADRHAALANLYADAFASDPQLAKNLGAGHRYNAARAAVLAGVGKGKDAGELGEEKRTRWLKQALDWLELEVAACAVKADGGTPAERQMVQQTLTAWREDPDLAVVRGPEIERLSIGDRGDWLAFWKKVDDVIHRAS
jgi:eukaryotic-like serine/threonine-protein kinase